VVHICNSLPKFQCLTLFQIVVVLTDSSWCTVTDRMKLILIDVMSSNWGFN
jgi:hypothetical protein